MTDFEMRWLTTVGSSPVLQTRYKRTLGGGNALGSPWEWSEWENVPTVAADVIPPQTVWMLNYGIGRILLFATRELAISVQVGGASTFIEPQPITVYGGSPSNKG